MAVAQVMLGLRSLLVKLAIFFVMAALLAWALGGTLFPRPEIVDHSRVTFQGTEWWLRMLAGGDQPGAVRWYLMERTGGKSFVQPSLHPDETHPGWLDATGPIIASDRMYVGFQDARSGWQIAVFEQAAPLTEVVPVLDRLAVERQFARLRRDLPLQTIDQERTLRSEVLDLSTTSSDSK